MRRRLNAALPCDHGSNSAVRAGVLTPSNLPRGRGRHAAPVECGFAVRFGSNSAVRATDAYPLQPPPWTEEACGIG